MSKYEETLKTALPILCGLDSMGLAFDRNAKYIFGWGSYDSTAKIYKLSLPTIWCLQERGQTLETLISSVSNQYSIEFKKAAKVWLMTDKDGPLVQALLATQISNYHCCGWTDLLDEDVFSYFSRERISVPIPDRDTVDSRILSLKEVITRIQVMSLTKSMNLGGK